VKSQRAPCLTQFRHDGRISSHLILRLLQVAHPVRTLVCFWIAPRVVDNALEVSDDDGEADMLAVLQGVEGRESEKARIFSHPAPPLSHMQPPVSDRCGDCITKKACSSWLALVSDTSDRSARVQALPTTPQSWIHLCCFMRSTAVGIVICQSTSDTKRIQYEPWKLTCHATHCTAAACAIMWSNESLRSFIAKHDHGTFPASSQCVVISFQSIVFKSFP
jgi:hypothetical protein